MSKSSLNTFLHELERELTKSSKTYRDQTANRRAHHFRFTTKDLVAQTLVELNTYRDLNFTANEIRPLANKMLGPLRLEANKMKARGVTGIVRGNQHFIYVYLITGVNPKTSKGYDIFTRLKSLYKKGLDTFAQDLNDLAHTKNKVIKKSYLDREGNLQFTDKEITRGSDLFEGGHEKEAGVFETRVRDVVETSAMKFLDKQDAMSKQDLMDDLALLGIDLSIIRNDAEDSHTITVESRIQNRLDGLTSAENREKLLKDLKFAIMKLPYGRGLENLKGSDSINDKYRKQTLEAVVDEFRKIGAQITTESLADKSRSSNSKKKRSATSKTVKNKNRVKVKKPKPRRKEAKTNTGIANLLPLLNTRINETVAKNMGDPRLNYRTGAFASSVRITDVARTAQGFPSIGYTYAKYPYQTYEVGYKRGDKDRDPRALIDVSIREIAAEMAVGRLYTRRL